MFFSVATNHQETMFTDVSWRAPIVNPLASHLSAPLWSYSLRSAIRNLMTNWVCLKMMHVSPCCAIIIRKIMINHEIWRCLVFRQNLFWHFWSRQNQQQGHGSESILVRSKADLSASFQKCQTAPSTPICWALLSTWQLWVLHLSVQ